MSLARRKGGEKELRVGEEMEEQIWAEREREREREREKERRRVEERERLAIG